MAVSSLPERKLIDVNESWLATLGFSRDEVIGRTPRELGLFVNPENNRSPLKEYKSKAQIEILNYRSGKRMEVSSKVCFPEQS